MPKYIILTTALLATIIMCLWPNFHPEQAVLKHYYWQADILIHAGYYCALTLLVLLLRLNIKPLYSIALLTGLSLSLEILQVFSYKRAVSLLDMGSNIAGIGVAVLLFFAVKNRIQKSTVIRN